MLFWSTYSSAILNIQVWSMDFLFMVRLVTRFYFWHKMSHVSHLCSVTRSWSHFGFSLEYQFWVWS